MYDKPEDGKPKDTISLEKISANAWDRKGEIHVVSGNDYMRSRRLPPTAAKATSPAMKDVNEKAEREGMTDEGFDMKTSPEKYREQRNIQESNPKSNFQAGLKMSMQRQHEMELREMH